jgi:hypothetical protein
MSKIIFNLNNNDISEVVEDNSNNLHYIYLNNINQAKEKKLSEIKNEILNLLYDDERNKEAKILADDFKKKFQSSKPYKKGNTNFIKEESTDWITWDNRLGKNININIKDLIFNTKLNSLSKTINLKKGIYVMVLPTAQSNNVLKEDNTSKVERVVNELNESIEADINRALLQDMSNRHKSNINQKFLNSF